MPAEPSHEDATALRLEAVTTESVSFSGPPAGPSDILFDGRRVMSFRGRHLTLTPEGTRRLLWPPPLHPYLSGSTRIEVRDHVSGQILLATEIAFDDAPHRTTIVDDHGRPMALDKRHELGPMFDTADPSALQDLLHQAQELIAALESFGTVAFIGYGTLLGAVRNGHVIGHDNDIDLLYLSKHQDVASIVQESLALERFLTGKGWQVDRPRASFIRVHTPDDAPGQAWMDVFMCFHDGDRLYVDQFVWADVPIESLVPTGTISLEGVELTAPRDPHRLMAATYGAGYLVPDPTFRHGRSPEQIRATEAWFGNLRHHQETWAIHHASVHPEPGSVSPLARNVADTLEPDGVVVDLGCGHGRDVLWLSRQGIRAIGVDHVEPVVTALREVAGAEDLPLEAWRMSFASLRQCIAHGALVASLPEPGRTVLMAQDLLDVLDVTARRNFWQLARTALLPGGRLIAAFRDHGPVIPRRCTAAMDPDLVLAEAVATGARLVGRDVDATHTTLTLTWV